MGVTIGLLHMRRSIFVQAPPARVWREFESFERITAWFSRGHTIHTFEPNVGGRVDFSIGEGATLRRFGGTVLLVEPEREITFEETWIPNEDGDPSTLWTLRLTPLYDGTLVEIIQHGMERLGPKAADYLEGLESHWDLKHLSALRAIVER